MGRKNKNAPKNPSNPAAWSLTVLSCSPAAISSVRISTIPAFGTIMETVTQKEVRIGPQATERLDGVIADA